MLSLVKSLHVGGDSSHIRIAIGKQEGFRYLGERCGFRKGRFWRSIRRELRQGEAGPVWSMRIGVFVAEAIGIRGSSRRSHGLFMPFRLIRSVEFGFTLWTASRNVKIVEVFPRILSTSTYLEEGELKVF